MMLTNLLYLICKISIIFIPCDCPLYHLAFTNFGNVQGASQFFVVTLGALEFTAILVGNAIGAANCFLIFQITWTICSFRYHCKCQKHNNKNRKVFHGCPFLNLFSTSEVYRLLSKMF